MDIHVVKPTSDVLLELYDKIFTEEAKQFLFELVTSFTKDVSQLFERRKKKSGSVGIFYKNRKD